MLDSWSTHDYEQNVSLDSMKTCLVCDLCFLGFGLNVHCALHVLSVWFVFVKKIMFSCFFFSFDLFFVWLFVFFLVSGQTMVFSLVQGWTSIFESSRLVFLCRVLRLYLVGFFYCWGIFGLRGCLTNTLLGLFWQFCFE
jgi:hypothetical protein